jgi:site-specific recombinase XerC
MINMRTPHVPEEPPPVLTKEDLLTLLKTRDGTGFEDRRDAAIIRLFVDSGMRLSELSGVRTTPTLGPLEHRTLRAH